MFASDDTIPSVTVSRRVPFERIQLLSSLLSSLLLRCRGGV